MLLLDFLDKNKIPYLKFSMKFKGKGKKDCGDGVVSGYQNFTYEEAMLWNTMRSKQKNKKAPENLALKIYHIFGGKWIKKIITPQTH